MFVVFCPRHRDRVLLDASCLIGVRNGPSGVVDVTWRCWCGEQGVTRTGRAAAAARR